MREIGVILDVGRLVNQGRFHNNEHVECVNLEDWQARELVTVLRAHKERAQPISYAFLNELVDALEGAL